METSRQLAGTSVEDAEAANLSLGRINEAIGAISDMATQIAAAAEGADLGDRRDQPQHREYPPRLPGAGGPGYEEAAQAAQLKSHRAAGAGDRALPALGCDPDVTKATPGRLYSSCMDVFVMHPLNNAGSWPLQQAQAEAQRGLM